MKRSTLTRAAGRAALLLLIASLVLPAAVPAAQAQQPAPEDSTPQLLPFGQDWTDTSLITVSHDWSGVPGVMGYRGDDLTTVTGTDPQTLLMDGTNTPVNVNANQLDPNTYTTGGLAEFEIANPVVAFQGSGTADAPFLLISLDTTGYNTIQVAYNLRDIDGSADNAIQQVALHYRIGNSGDFTNLPGGYVYDATTGPNLADLVTPILVTLPSTADNQPLVQIRVMTTNAVGSDEWVGVDDISITGAAGDLAPTVTATDPAGGAVDVPADTNLTVTFSEPVNVAGTWFDITCATSGSHTAAVTGGPQVFTLDPDAGFAGGELCTATIYAAGVTDQDTFDPPDNMEADYVWSFTIAIADAAPYVVSTDPANGAVAVPAYADLSVTFSEPVSVLDGWYDITCATSGSHAATVSGGDTTFTLDPAANFAPGESCTATIYAAYIADLDPDDPPDGMLADYAWSFTVDTVGPCNDLFFSEYVEGSSNNKALEIVNPTASPVDLAGYDIQVYFNGSPNPGQTFALAGTLAAGDVFLFCHASASFAASCDQTTTVGLYNGDDAVVLRRNGHIIDSIGQIGYDPGYEWGTGNLSTQDNTLRRKAAVSYGDEIANDGFVAALLAEWDGYPQDTFDGLGSHTFQCGEVAPYVIGTLPDAGKIQVPVDGNLTVDFKEPVNASPTAFDLACSVSGAHTLAVSGGPVAFTLNPDADLATCEVCTLTVLAAEVTDQDGDDPPDTMTADYSTTFSTACGCNTIPIIQGTGASSPCEGQYVTVSGCVTGVAATGFYMQDTAGDGNPASSDGIYVYMYSGWANPEGIEAGYSATTTNFQVQEYYNATELYKGSGSATKGAACTLPAPATVQQIPVLGPADVNYYESTEFMRVQMDVDGFVQGPTKRYASRFANGDPEIGFILWGLESTLPNPPRLFEEDYAGYGGLNYLTGGLDKNLPDVGWGDRIQGTGIVGVMGYHFDKWQILVDGTLSQSLNVTKAAITPDVEAPLAADDFGVCTFNLSNMFDWINDGDGDIGDWQPPDEATYQVMLEKRARAIVENMAGCTVIGVQEMEGKDQVWLDLEAKIEAVAGPGTDFAWDYYESMDERDITVGVLYDTSKVTLLSSTQRQGCTTTDYGVSYAWAVGPRVVPNPCEAGTYPLFDRPPYVAQLQVSGGPELTLIVNHFKSMSGSASGTRPWREAQAQWNADLAWEYSAVTPDLAIMGDLNDYIGSSPIAILDAALTQDGYPLVNLLAGMPKLDQYTYNYGGESEVLDYIYLSQAFAADWLKAASPVHINADYPNVAPMDSNNCPVGGICTFDVLPEDSTSLHSSDHEPVFVRLGPPCDPVHDAAFTWTPLHPYVGREVAFEATALGNEPIDYAWDFGDGSTGSGASATHAYAAPGDYVVTLTASNACGLQVVQHTVTVTLLPTMHVAGIELAHRSDRPRQSWVIGRLTILDQDGVAVRQARVRVEWTDPSGVVWVQQEVTDLWGQARFQLRAKLPGTYRLCVTNVSRSGMIYDPGQNVETCDSIALSTLGQ